MSTVIRDAVRRAALVAPFVWLLIAAPVSAQSCPTSGAGTTCFGGQLFCASSGQCYNPPSCGGNQVMDCNACGCVCNTATYPCGGCTAASSTQGASCTGNSSCPTGGTYANQCSVVGCPSGTTICPAPAPGRCVADRACPAGTTWDVCTDTCGTPYVLLSPGFTQNGFISISGEVRTSAGNLRLDSAAGANQGDVFMANGKAIRIDGSGTTQLTVGNYGVGGVAANLKVLGAVFGGGFSAIAGDTAVASGTVDASQLCLGNGVNCRSTWPSAADFDPTFVNAAGDTMTGDLNLAGAATDLFVAGNVGVGTTSPAVRLAVGGSGANVYATDVWVENNMHVQGNEAMAQGGGRGRLRVGTAWGYPGLYAEGASNGAGTDLVLGASSDHVLINAGSFGRPGGSATFELWGSRISDTGGGTLHIQSGGGVVAFDGGDTVVLNNALQLGGVARSTWPSLSVINTTATLYTWQGAGWKSVSCPAGYAVTGWSGYNCMSHGGEWECTTSYLHQTYVDVYYSAEGTAYISINCAALN